MKKVLVTGASGFVGSHLCETLSKQGYEVYGLIRNPKSQDYSFTVIKGDLSLKSIQSWINELPEDLDTAIHTAGVVHSFSKEVFERVNFQGTVDLFDELVKKYPTNFHFEFTSSLAAVGPSAKGAPHTESCELNPPSLYGQSKKKAEAYLREHKPESWKLTIVRPPMVIGPRDPAVLDVFKMVKSKLVLASGLNGMEKEYSFVCVFDLVDLMIKAAMESSKPDEVSLFFPAYPEIVRYGQIIDQIKEEMSCSTVTLPVPLPLIKGLAGTINLLQKVAPIDFRLTPDKIHELTPDYWTVSSELSQRELGMEYQWDLAKTVAVTYSDYKERGWV